MAADDMATMPERAAQALSGLSDPATLQLVAGNVFLAVAIMLVLTGLYKIAPRIWSAVEDTLTSNWRLGVLAATGLALSLASGWRTWDGMRNFTNEPVLSGLITFGVQGVMLVIAWLIGESFATGMNQQSTSRPPGTLSRGMQAVWGAVIGILLAVGLGMLLLQGSGQIALSNGAAPGMDFWALSDQLLIVAVGLLMAALVALYSASDLVKPYLQGFRVIARNAALWVMFVACAGTSVFFSFDSFFSGIFPEHERARAAELRAQNQVSGVVADIGATIDSRRISLAEDLFRSEGWQTYDQQLERLASASRGAENEIEAYYVQKMEERRRAIAEQQERITTAQSGQAGLSVNKTNLTEELSRLEADRPALAADLQQRKSDLDARAKEVDAKRVEAMAEEKGVEGTLKEGRGPIYRQRKSELAKLQDFYKIGEERVKDAQKRVDEVNSRIDQVKRQLAEIDGSLAKLQGEAQTAQQRIEVSTSSNAEADVPRIDPARVLPAFETARHEFRQKPDAPVLQTVQEQCSQLLNAMTSTPTTKDRVKGIDCDPKQVQEAAAVLFALNVGARAYAANCVGGDKLAANTSTDALFGFGRKCLADSQLPSKDTDDLRQKINGMELARDDRAHRFVVTLNAFNDGNHLAYLALAIAIGLDSLIFLSGLFAANAVRSPLSDVPSTKARSAQQLEVIIENALLPDTFENASLTLKAMRPITNVAGFMAEVKPDRLDPHTADRVLGVLNAGATIHAVAYDHEQDSYLVRAELFEFLSAVSKKAFEKSEHHATEAELEKILAVSLLPDIAANVDTVLSYMHPITEKHGFTAEVKMQEVAEGDLRTVRNLLNAGSVHQRVQRATEGGDHYFVHRDLYKTLAKIRARSMFSAAPAGVSYRLERDSQATFGGALNPQPALTHQSQGQPRGLEPAGAQLPPPIPTVAERGSVRDQLMMAMGFAPSDYRDMLINGSLAHVNAAAHQLHRLSRRHGTLGGHIETAIADLRSDLDNAAAGLKQDHYSPALVDEVETEITSILPALLLLQRGRYQAILNDYIDRLEQADGEGALNNQERHLLYRLRQHESNLSKMPRVGADDWRRVADLLADFGTDPSEGGLGNAEGRRIN